MGRSLLDALGKSISLVRIPAMLGGTLGCGAWCLGVAWADRRNLPDQLKMNALSGLNNRGLFS